MAVLAKERCNRLLMKAPILNTHSGCDSFTIYDYLI